MEVDESKTLTCIINLSQQSPGNALFQSFRPHDFDSSATRLQQVSPLMTASRLILNSSETEFLLISLQQQLAKIHNCSLPPTQPGILVASSTVVSLSLTKSQLSLQISYIKLIGPIIFVNFAVSAPILTSKLPVLLLHLLFTLNSITATLCTTTLQVIQSSCPGCG